MKTQDKQFWLYVPLAGIFLTCFLLWLTDASHWFLGMPWLLGIAVQKVFRDIQTVRKKWTPGKGKTHRLWQLSICWFVLFFWSFRSFYLLSTHMWLSVGRISHKFSTQVSLFINAAREFRIISSQSVFKEMNGLSRTLLWGCWLLSNRPLLQLWNSLHLRRT